VILKVVNASGAAEETRMNLTGADHVGGEAKSVTLTSAGLSDENTFEHPTKVAPVERNLTGISPSFRYTFPAHSVTILRIPAAAAKTAAAR
jgi:alpha-L-arabinofuranosidase